MPGGSGAGNKQKSDKLGEGEKVLCYHGPLIYEAKINKIQMKDKSLQYLVHYSGWSKSWDEWVPESRVLKINDTNLQKQKELQQQHPLVEKQRKTGTKRKSDKKGREFEPATRRRRMMRQDISETRDSSPSRPEVKIEFPDGIKKSLVDDWDIITRQKQLVRLPKEVTVSVILSHYREHVKNSDPDKNLSGQLTEICQGLQDYFDVMLGTQLLYKFERPQYSDILQSYPDKSPSDIYGIEHFLRLFVRLGAMLVYTSVDDELLSMLQTHIHELLGFLNDSLSLFTVQYDAATAEYLRRLV